ncbi:hypothetical protein ACWCQW_23045 [Streptomyces mirabilis]
MVTVGEDLPEPTVHRGQYVIPLDMAQEDWLEFLGVSYYVTPDIGIPVSTSAFSLRVEDEEIELTCQVYNEVGEHIQDLVVENPKKPWGGDAFGPPIPLDRLSGTSMTFRFNYRNSVNVRDLVLTLDFGDPLVVALNRRRIAFRLARRPVSDTGLRRRERDRPTSAAAPGPSTPLLYLHGYEDPDTGYETPATRVPPVALTPQRIGAAWQTAKATGYFDPAVFPNVIGAEDAAWRAGVAEALAPLDEATVVKQLLSGARLAVQRGVTGDYTYRFLAVPPHCQPGLILVEYYRLSAFPARYGAGRVIKTFSLLPGERTNIRVNTYKRSSTSIQQASSILDATNNETENEFTNSVNSEQSSQENASKSFEYRAEAEAEGQATWGWGSAKAKVSGGVSGGNNSAREEFAKNLTNAVSQNAARAASRREVQVDTSLDAKLEEGEEQAAERTLENINVSRTLNFVFRQMNQEYVSLLHLVDVRVAFFNGHAESRDEVPLAELDRLLADCVRPESVDAVRTRVVTELQAIQDHRGEVRSDFVQTVRDGGDTGPLYARVNPDFTSDFPAPDGRTLQVPGVIVGAESHVMRTDGMVVETFLGEGNGLDAYSVGLQEQAVREKRVANQLQELEGDRLRLALQIVKDNDAARMELYQRMFVRPQIINQIDHAAVNGVRGADLPDGLAATGGTNGTGDPRVP